MSMRKRLAVATTLLAVAATFIPATAAEEGALWTGDYLESADFVPVTGSGAFAPTPGLIAGRSTMSDPRASGEWLAGYQWHCEPEESCSTWGQAVLTNDGGTWEGDFVAFNGPAPSHLQNLMVWMNGTGDYEGWSYVANFVGPLAESIGAGLLVHAPYPAEASLSFP